MKPLTSRFLLIASASLAFLTGCSPSKPQLPERPVSQTAGNCFLDAQKRSDSTVRLDGWAYGDPQEAPSGIAVKVEAPTGTRTFYSQKLLSRSDVAKAFGSPKLMKTGFTIKIPATEAPAGAKVSIISEGSSQNYLCKNSFALK